MRRLPAALTLAAFAAAVVAAPPFTLDSPTLAADARMPMANVYAECAGGNQSPALRWHDPPAGTQSYAVTMFDPGADFWHWIAFDIAVGAHGLNAAAGTPRSGNVPGDTVQLKNDFGTSGYAGPCPPPGKPHRYVITVYALNVPELGIATHFDRKAALDAIRQHTLAKASLTVDWGR